MRKVAIVAALPREVRDFIKKRGLRAKVCGAGTPARSAGSMADAVAGRSARATLQFFEGEDLVLVCGGIGAEAARRAAEAVITNYSPTVVYSVGFAGALDSTHKVGDVVQPAYVIDARDGSRVNLNEGKGVLVSFGSVASPQQKAKLRESYGAQLVDMEAAAVARAAEARGLQFASVKAISDESDFTFPEIERFVDSQGQFHQGKFAMFAVLRPWLWPKLRRLAINSNLAASALCDWLVTSLNQMIARAADPTRKTAPHP